MTVDPADFADYVCCAKSPRGYLCGLAPNHDGQHEAFIEDDTVVDLW